MEAKYVIQIVQVEISEAGPQAVARIIEANGDTHEVRILCHPDGSTEVGEPTHRQMMPYLRERYGPQLVVELREAVCRACS